MIRRSLAFLSIAFVVALTAAPTEAQQCDSLTMTVTATFPNDAGFEGLWKYTLTGTWDLGSGAPALSHINIVPELGICECICEEDLFVFPTPAGTSTGIDANDQPCVEQYEGEFLCSGDPSLDPPENARATVKFDALNIGCEPDRTGEGTWCFYTRLSPAGAATYPEGIQVKYDGLQCVGPVAGQLPMCDCNVSVDAKTWGAVKKEFKDKELK